MSEFEETSGLDERECPYCGESYQPETEDFSEDARVETCDSCGKKYHAVDSVSISYEAAPDCSLNDGQHKYEDLGHAYLFCATCGQIGPRKEDK